MPLICRRSVPQQVTVKPGVFLAEMVRIPPASEMEVMETAGADSEPDWILEGEPREKEATSDDGTRCCSPRGGKNASSHT